MLKLGARRRNQRSGNSRFTSMNMKKKILTKKHSYIIGINFRPTNICADKAFIRNVRLFTEQSNLKYVIVTSDIQAEDVPMLNCGSYLNNSDMADNENKLTKADLIKKRLAPRDFSDPTSVKMVSDKKLVQICKYPIPRYQLRLRLSHRAGLCQRG